MKTKAETLFFKLTWLLFSIFQLQWNC